MDEQAENAKLDASDTAFRKDRSFFDHYTVLRENKAGPSSEVRLCRIIDTQEYRIVHVLNKDSIDDTQITTLKNEISALVNFNHPNIAKICECFEDDRKIYVVSEIIEGGDLLSDISHRSTFDEKDCIVIMKQLLSAINYCHDNKIIHRDMNLENIMLEESKNLESLKIIGFGTSLSFDLDRALTEKPGAVLYIAPEVINQNDNEKSNLWSCGVIMYILLCGEPPFNDPDENNGAILKKILKGEYEISQGVWEHISNEAKDLVQKLLTLDPAQRISAKEALEHPWINKNQDEVHDDAGSISLHSLKDFIGHHQLKVALCNNIDFLKTSNSKKMKFYQIMSELDTKKDGEATKQEITKGYEETFDKIFDGNDFDEIFLSYNASNCYKVDYSSFISAIINEMKSLYGEKLEYAFKIYDSDGNGTISPHILKNLLSNSGKISDKVINDIFNE